MTVDYQTLPNGLRLALRRLASPVEICGLAVDVGSRDESVGEEGLAHLVEHTIFKGTDRRRASDINRRMEAVGGELNAYTTEEETFVYAVAPRGNAARAIDLIADLIKNSRFPAREVDKEKEVVCDEIDSYLDTPGEGIFDDFEELVYEGSSLAHNILGSKTDVMRLDGSDCRRFLDRFYTPGHMVFFYQGDARRGTIERLVERHLGSLSNPETDRRRVTPAPCAPFAIRRNRGLHQAHCLTGARTGGLDSPLRLATELVTNILGGPGMNSLLNVELREKRGLVYNIDASTSLLSDTGLVTAYLGCDYADTDRCLALVGRVFDSLVRRPLTARRLAAAKKQYLGQLTVGSTNQENTALAMGRSVLRFGRVATFSELATRIEAITADDVLAAAEALRSEACSSLVLC